MGLLSHRVAEKKDILVPISTAQAQRVVRALAEHFVLEVKQSSPASVAATNFRSSTPENCHRFRVRPSTVPSRIHLRLASTLLSQNKSRPNFPYRGYKIIVSRLQSANSSDEEPFQSCRAGSG